jgi:hypothetical protein
MRAKISGANEFGTANDYCRHCEAERQAPFLSQNASATEAWLSQLSRMAEREARAILAETEPTPRLSDWTMVLPLDCVPAQSEMGSCIIDALRAFVS